MNDTLAAYAYFKGFEDTLRIAANAAAVAGIENGATLFTAMATFLVIWIGITMAAGGMTADRLKSVILRIVLVVALITEGYYMTYIAPAIVDDLPNMINDASKIGGGGDLYSKFSAMEGAIFSAIAKGAKATSGGWITDNIISGLVQIYAGVVGMLCSILVGVMFLTVLFYRLSLYLLMVYGAWLAVVALYQFSIGWFLSVFSQVVSILCGFIGTNVVFDAMIVGLDSFTGNMIVATTTMKFFDAIMALSQLTGMVFFCAALLVIAGITAARIGGSMVPAAGTAAAMAAGNKMVQAASTINRAAQALQRARKL